MQFRKKILIFEASYLTVSAEAATKRNRLSRPGEIEQGQHKSPLGRTPALLEKTPRAMKIEAQRGLTNGDYCPPPRQGHKGLAIALARVSAARARASRSGGTRGTAVSCALKLEWGGVEELHFVDARVRVRLGRADGRVRGRGAGVVVVFGAVGLGRGGGVGFDIGVGAVNILCARALVRLVGRVENVLREDCSADGNVLLRRSANLLLERASVHKKAIQEAVSRGQAYL